MNSKAGFLVLLIVSFCGKIEACVFNRELLFFNRVLDLSGDEIGLNVVPIEVERDGSGSGICSILELIQTDFLKKKVKILIIRG